MFSREVAKRYAAHEAKMKLVVGGEALALIDPSGRAIACFAGGTGRPLPQQLRKTRRALVDLGVIQRGKRRGTGPRRGRRGTGRRA